MKEIKLVDLYPQELIEKYKEKIPQLPKMQQRMMMDVLFQDLDKIIREKFPDIQRTEYHTDNILREEFPYAFHP